MGMSRDAVQVSTHFNSLSCCNGISSLEMLLIRESPNQIVITSVVS